MEVVGEGAVLVFAVGLLAAIAAVVIVLLALGTLRRSIRRIAGQLSDLRRHPLVGEVVPETTPALGSLTRELNHLINDLREQVRETRARASDLQALVEGPSDVAFIGVDAEWRVVAFGGGAVQLTQWSVEQIMDHHVEILFAPGEWERLLPKLSRRSLREGGFAEKVRLLKRDGDAVTTRLSVEPLGRESGSGGLLLSARDLREEEALERRLRASEERYRRLVEEIRDGALILQRGRILYANPAIATLLGLQREQLAGSPFKAVLDTRDLLRVLERLDRAESGGEDTGETSCRLATPGRAPVEARLAWVATEYQGSRALFVTIVDLTERARFERVVAESAAHLKATLEATGDGILVVGDRPEGKAVTVANRAFCELLGIVPESILGLPESSATAVLLERIGDPASLQSFIEAARSGQEVRRDGVEIAGPRRALVDLIAGPVQSTPGGRLGWILTARDVTARAESERRLQDGLDELSEAKADLESSYRNLSETQRTLAERNEQLEKLNIELRSLDEMKSNLLANVSHELHTPLVSIKGYTEMIVRRRLGPLTQEQERGLSVALKNIDRLIEMIDNLLSFARMETGETQLTVEDIPLWLLVDESIELVSERIRKKNLTVSSHYEADDLRVRGDRVKLGQVLTNLLTNAVKFNQEGGSIRISARAGTKGFVEVEVADTGIGIPPEEQERIFDRFYQVESGPRRRYDGAGIGLSIVRDILRLHGCAIRVGSEPGQGSTFTFTLPRAGRPQPSETQSPPSRGRSRD